MSNVNNTSKVTQSSPFAVAQDAASTILASAGLDSVDIALVLGSGWGGAADALGETITELAAEEVPGFAASGVAGHSGTLRVIRFEVFGRPRHALVLGARTHYYEGRGVRAVAHGMRTAAAAGAATVVLTNGCGGLNPDWAPGTPVLISDHLNLTADSPVEGATFVDLTDLYSPRLRDLARQIDPTLAEGVYAQFRGPHYETPAEVRMAATLGADLVGMSTALEAIAAREAGLEVFGISLVTNLAAGISPIPLDHADVIAAGRAAEPRLAKLLTEIVKKAVGSGELSALVREWIADDPDEATAAELTGLLEAAEGGDPAARADLEDRFSGLLQFGTAGLRGELGGGPNRMNRAVVARAAAGIAAFLNDTVREDPVVVIGYDARHGSEQFAKDSAQIFAGAGATVHLFDQHTPTPVLAYAVRELGADAGVMVTASHNPPRDNGYKVYLGGRAVPEPERGAQIVSPYDAEIARHIAAVGAVADLPRADGSEGIRSVGADLISSYLRAVGAITPAVNPAPDLKIVYTPMHGVGGDLLARALSAAGFTDLTPVAAQLQPDPDFPTVTFPNPEEAGALDLAFETAAEVGADLVVANDPDADRVSIAVPTGQGWRQLSGDEIGVLLGEYVAAHAAAGATVLANSVVSSRLLGAIAEHHGAAHHETLTGFKWIARAPGITYGYEEAIGYCVQPDVVRDKDGISAGLLLAVLTAELRAAGRTLTDALDDLALRHGLYLTGALSVRVEDLTEITSAMARLRAEPPTALAGSPVSRVLDLSEPTDGLPATDALIYLTGAKDRVIVRPSGTEPKIKCYLEVIGRVRGPESLPDARLAATARLETLKEDIAAAAGLDDR